MCRVSVAKRRYECERERKREEREKEDSPPAPSLLISRPPVRSVADCKIASERTSEGITTSGSASRLQRQRSEHGTASDDQQICAGGLVSLIVLLLALAVRDDKPARLRSNGL